MTAVSVRSMAFLVAFIASAQFAQADDRKVALLSVSDYTAINPYSQDAQELCPKTVDVKIVDLNVLLLSSESDSAGLIKSDLRYTYTSKESLSDVREIHTDNFGSNTGFGGAMLDRADDGNWPSIAYDFYTNIAIFGQVGEKFAFCNYDLVKK